MRCGGERGLDGGDLSKPTLFGFGEAVEEVGVDLFKSGLLT